MAEFLQKVVVRTELNADSVEWCPILGYRHLLVCGTYQLSDAENSKAEGDRDPSELRRGHLYLFRLEEGPQLLGQLQKIPMVGILDCKWAHRQLYANIYLAIATAIGDIRIYRLKDEVSVWLEHVTTHEVCPKPGVLALSLDWSTGLYDSDVRILLSDSEGGVTIMPFAGGKLSQERKWNLHQFQAWIVAFNYWDTNVFYSGGDDCKLHIYDRRSERVSKNERVHTAGITSMHSNGKRQHQLISGSYDEKVVFWDVRQMAKAQDVVETGGGVWRLKWDPRECEDIAAACMHNGFAVIHGLNPSVLAECKDHTSLAYGIDWSHLEESELNNYFHGESYSNKTVHALAMCSFYDNMLSVALFQKEK